MMKLLKYDIKRNANTFLGLAAVLVIVQALLSIIGNLRRWDEAAILALTVILYLSTAIIMLVMVCKTFDHNIKAYHRRLLPVHPAWSIVSSLLFSWIVALAMAVIIAVHVILYVRIVGLPVNIVIDPEGVKDWSLAIVSAVWIYTLFVLTIFMSITIGASVSIRGKAGTWVGILSFFVIQNGLSWLEMLIFGGSDQAILKFGTVHIGTSEEIRTGTAEAVNLLSLGSLLFEFAFAALMFYAITYLLSKRIEI